jgi:hypothetical protein
MRAFMAACACVAGLGISASSVYAHHSMTGFERTKTVTLVGTVKQFKWANPHSWIELEVPNEKGGSDTWNVEMTAPGILARAGWKSNIIKPGDKVTIVGRPLITGEPGAIFVSLTLENGTTLTDRMKQPDPAPAAAAKQ